MIKVINVVGARPNFMKIAPIHNEMQRRDTEFSPVLVHTGQHYDDKMSDVFFEDLGLPQPDFYLGVGSGSHAAQTAGVMTAFERVALEERPDWAVVAGDVNSTLACALVCSKMGIRIAHVEAGLRSYDRKMPEEINRVLTDALSDLLLTHSAGAESNLIREGADASAIRFVGNVMIDSLFAKLDSAKGSNITQRLEIRDGEYAVATMHRPSNVDEKEMLSGLIGAMIEISDEIPVVFPAHPRTLKMINDFGMLEAISDSDIRLIEPVGYIDFLRLVIGSRFVITDSGGIQEETTALLVPCLTIRENTERPVTVELGTNRIVGADPARLKSAAREILETPPEGISGERPPLWDGKSAGRICDAIAGFGNARPDRS